jgi:hypothetical protein
MVVWLLFFSLFHEELSFPARHIYLTLNEKFYKILGWLLVLEAGSWCYSPFCEALQHIHFDGVAARI